MIGQAKEKSLPVTRTCAFVIVKQMVNFTYQELAFHIVDSKSFRRFMRIGIADKGFKKSVL
jgi:hypothetical protein